MDRSTPAVAGGRTGKYGVMNNGEDAGPGGQPQARVVGACRDIGRAIAREMAALGMTQALWGRARDRLEGKAAGCAGRSFVDVVDVTDAAALGRAAGELASRGSLKVVAYAAGVFDWAPADTADPFVSAAVVGVNLTAAVTV